MACAVRQLSPDAESPDGTSVLFEIREALTCDDATGDALSLECRDNTSGFELRWIADADDAYHISVQSNDHRSVSIGLLLSAIRIHLHASHII